MEHPENREGSGIETVTERVRRLEENGKDANNDGTTAAYVRQSNYWQQISTEKDKREKIWPVKWRTYGCYCNTSAKKYQTLYHEVLAIQNGNDVSTRTERAYKE